MSHGRMKECMDGDGMRIMRSVYEEAVSLNEAEWEAIMEALSPRFFFQAGLDG